MSQPNQKLTKNERRELAREQARQAREAQLKKEKRSKLMLQGGIVLAVVAVLAIVGIVIAQVVKPAGPGPENMASGGIVFEGENLEVRQTEAIQPGEQLVAAETDRTEPLLDVVVYVDYLCPYCRTFEEQAGGILEQWVGSGQATLQIYPVNIQDNLSKGSRYSTRAANAFACVAEQQPDAAWDTHSRLLSADVQPAQGTSGLTNDQLYQVALDAGATESTSLRQCINNVPYADFISKSTNQALRGPLVGISEDATEAEQSINGTPSVFLNGRLASTTPAELENQMLLLFAELSGADSGADSSEEEDAEPTD